MSSAVNTESIWVIKPNEGLGPDVTPGLKITQETVEQLLRGDLERFQGEWMKQSIDDGAKASPNQYDAMVSLAFNIGCEHNARRKQAAADAFLMWNEAGSKVLRGLERRRHEERLLLSKV